MNLIANNIRHLRKRGQYGQEEFAQLFQLTQTAISAYELGKNIPPPDILLMISSLFNISINDLLKTDLSADVVGLEYVLKANVDAETEKLKQQIADLRTLVETQQALIGVLNNKNINK